MNEVHKELSQTEVEEIKTDMNWPDADSRFEKLEEDLYYILIEKTTGQGLEKVQATTPGQGVTAFIRLFVWFGCCSGLAIQERTRRIMNPNSPKKEEDISASLESWLEEVSLVEAHGQAYALPALYKITSLRIIMDVKRDKFDDMIQACETERDDEKRYVMLIKMIRQYAGNRRLEATSRKSMPTPMQIGQVADEQCHKCEDYESQEYFPGRVDNVNQENDGWNHVDAVGKGKSLGKGFKGQSKSKGKGSGSGMYSHLPCFSCGAFGHLARECPNSKGKGKSGKDPAWYHSGWYTPQCTRCGQWGHVATTCRVKGVKGKRKR